MQKLTRKQRYDLKRQELLNLKKELHKAKGAYKRQTLLSEIRAVARELVNLQD